VIVMSGFLEGSSEMGTRSILFTVLLFVDGTLLVQERRQKQRCRLAGSSEEAVVIRPLLRFTSTYQCLEIDFALAIQVHVNTQYPYMKTRWV
jgi:hypothetical protein